MHSWFVLDKLRDDYEVSLGCQARCSVTDQKCLIENKPYSFFSEIKQKAILTFSIHQYIISLNSSFQKQKTSKQTRLTEFVHFHVYKVSPSSLQISHIIFCVCANERYSVILPKPVRKSWTLSFWNSEKRVLRSPLSQFLAHSSLILSDGFFKFAAQSVLNDLWYRLILPDDQTVNTTFVS